MPYKIIVFQRWQVLTYKSAVIGRDDFVTQIDGTATLLSYFVGQKKYRIDYPLMDILIYVLAAAVLYAGMVYVNGHLSKWPALGVNIMLILAFCGLIIKRDLPLSTLPVIGKYFKKG